ncbi:hypothetical protein CPB84DRAFT_1792190 [Gymnopilus junonius]|uniref:NAD-dependent epimerase/dehydratase domain-containing protein n=1 Tax=Gymnopilus junonius TaxID=109634 RepID=A0A9P5NBV7_GYMJU|nr:hypothetical protein CPB84DRAFT_1792190 [Gymnopilus junonius]
MPTITKGDKVLVSGANGYIAMWVVRHLLERGYAVRGTVRSESKGKFVKEYFASLGHGDNLELVIVEDIEKEGAFDEAVKGVDAIAHTASPFHSNVKQPEEFLRPAIQGTVGMLKSALKNGSKVKRIVVTSSTASILNPSDKPSVLSERDWNTSSPKEVEEKGADAPPMVIYRASKTLAEKSAWQFVEEHKSELKWDLAVINPPFVFGPPIHDVSSPASLNTSLKSWYDNVVADTPKTKDALSFSSGWVDVRDTSLAHVLALEKEAAGGERIISTGGSFSYQEWINVANSLPPPVYPSHKLPTGIPELFNSETVYNVVYDKSKEEKILGIKFHTKEETTKDTLEDFARRGW